jgi:hypothetical protein
LHLGLYDEESLLDVSLSPKPVCETKPDLTTLPEKDKPYSIVGQSFSARGTVFW